MSLSKIDSIDTEIEQVDQEKYLRQATQYYCALEKPKVWTSYRHLAGFNISSSS